MRETITIQVGQCGNQIGNKFWQLLLNEHENTPDDDDALSAFFRFSSRKSSSEQSNMKARALLIDMECGPLTETMRSPLGSLFDSTQFVMDVSGSGNNFAHGYYMYGPQYRDKFEEGLRRNAEECDSLQTFLVTHSLGGGTGSGVGSYVVGLLDDIFPEVYRFSACVFPSEDNDVVTSPYNSTLATNQLLEHADCVLPIDNAALQAFAQLEAQQRKPTREKTSNVSSMTDQHDQGFNGMNDVAARMLCHLTSSSRFHGDMNVDLNELCTNLIPFPRLKFLMSALSPCRSTGGGKSNGFSAVGDRAYLQRAFTDILRPAGQITAADPSTKGAITIASAFLARGEVPLSEFLACVTAAQQHSLVFPEWNQEACKVGMCGTPAPGERMSVLGVYNSTAFGGVLQREHSRFSQLFKRRAMLHHYTEYCDFGEIAEADVNVQNAIRDYHDIERGVGNSNSNDQMYKERIFPSF